MCIRQVAALVGYGEPQVLEVFKNTFQCRFYWVLFPVEDLGQAVETSTRILTKEKIERVDRQLAGQSSSKPFMDIQDGYSNNKKVATFDTQERLDDKLHKIMFMMSKQTARGSSQNRSVNPKIYQANKEDKLDIIMIKIDIRIGVYQTVVIGEHHIEEEISMDKITEEGHSMIKIIEVILGGEI